MKRYPAQISFVQSSSDEDTWIGRLVNREDTIDTVTGLPATKLRFKCVIQQVPGEAYVTLTLQGASTGGRRHFHHDTVTEAQEHAIKWVARRFKVEVT